MTTISVYHATILLFYFMFQISNSYNTTTSKPIGFSTYLIHQDSLRYNQYVNETDILTRTIIRSRSRSRSRLSYLKSILKLPKNHAVETTGFESTITFVPSMYLMEIYVGTPPVKQMVDVDTGSDMTWIQCLPCQNCFQQNLPIFNSDRSSSYQVLECSSDECSKLTTYRNCTPHTNELCKYLKSYSDGASSYGELVKETYTIGDISIPNILHGCGHNNIGEFDEQSTGMFGLGYSPFSFLGQIENSIGGMFSYCLVSDFNSNRNTRSKISFGNNAIVNGHGVVSTPLFMRTGISYYFLTLESISVGYRTIQMRRSRIQSGNIMIDTGTPLSYLPSGVFENLIEALREEIDKRPVYVPDEFCYPIGTDIPTITFHFANGANLALSKKNTFSIYEDGFVNALCLDIQKDDNLPVFGSHSQMNFLIGYNIPRKEVYFKPTNCSSPIMTT